MSVADTDLASDWLPLIARVGQPLGDGNIVWGADRIELGTIRRFLEPLEFDCPIHRDHAVAVAAGYAGVTAPYASILAFMLPALWDGCEAAFPEVGRDAQPARSIGGEPPVGLSDAYPCILATDMDFEFLREPLVGERLGRRAGRLLSCEPKQTRIGRGAFIKTETEIVIEEGKIVARMFTGTYVYRSDVPV